MVYCQWKYLGTVELFHSNIDLADQTQISKVKITQLLPHCDILTHLAHHEQSYLLVGGVGAEDQAVDGVVLALGPRNVRQPLRGQGGPLQRMRHHL